MAQRCASPTCFWFSRRAALATWPLLVSALCACGGSSSSTARTPDDEASEHSGLAMPDNAPPDDPLLDCGDGTCSRCGEGICTQGMYCDESATGGPACSWLPECPESPGCACIEKALGSRCECEEQDGAAHVTCKK